MITTNAYQKVWAYYNYLKATDDILPKSEDEVLTILSGKCKYLDRVVIEEDPMFNYGQEARREATRWMYVFDLPQIFVIRIVPFIRDYPVTAAILAGAIPMAVIVGLIGTSLLWMIGWCFGGAVVSTLLLRSLFKEGSNRINAREASGEMWIPRLSPGHRYESDLVVRGLLGEFIWLIQLVLMFKAMLFA